MKPLSYKLKIALVALASVAMVACGKDKVEQPDKTLSVRFTNLLHTPFQVTDLDTVVVSVKVTAVNGTVNVVSLGYTTTLYDDVKDASHVDMTRVSTGLYEAKIPLQAAQTVVKYWVEAEGVDLDNSPFVKQSDFGNYIVAESSEPQPEDPLAKIRINEIATSSETGKFIELYNTSDEAVDITTLELYRNGDYTEPYATFFGKTLPAGGYGVFSAKNTSLALPESCVDLGQTDKGLTGSRSLKLELGKSSGLKIYDTFCNTVNPDTGATDWDDDAAELQGALYARFTDGWYTAGIITAGEANLDPVTKLKHQATASLAVADAPYVSILGFNPTGVAAGAAVEVYAKVYTDVYSTIKSVKCTINGTSLTLAAGVDDRYSASYTFPAEGSVKATVVATNADSRSTSLDNTVDVCPAGTVFGTQAEVRMNEIHTGSKYIEFYNTSENPVNLVGMYIEKNNEDIILFISDNRVIKGHQYAVLACSDKDYSSNDYMYLGSVSNGVSGKKSLCLEWMATIPEKVRIDSFCNTSDPAPKPKTSVWDSTTAIEANIEDMAIGRRPDGSVNWYTLSVSSMGLSNNSASAMRQLVNQLAK